jgi:putative salt-induced outer membrane protein
MMRMILVAGMLVAWYGFDAAAAAAQDQPKPVTFTADFGFVNTAGNASQTTLSASDAFSVVVGRWAVRQEFQLIHGQNDSTTITSFYRARVRIENNAGAKLAPFVYVQWDRNAPAGLARRLEEGGGLTYAALARVRDSLAFDLGATLVQQRFMTLPDQDFAAARAALRYHHLFASKTELTQLVEYLPDLTGFGNFQLNTETTATAPITRLFALKASYIVRFNNQPPEGRQRTDRFLTVGVQIRP